MGMLDDLLLGRRGDTSITSAIMQDYLNREVTSLGGRSVAFERTNDSGAMRGAAVALSRTGAGIPDGFFNSVSSKAPNTKGSSQLAFPSATMAADYEKLKSAGIGPGSSLSDLMAVIQADGPAGKDGKPSQLQEFLQQMLGNDGKKRQPFGSTDEKTRASSDGFASANTKFLQGYRANGGKTNNDPSALGNYLSELSLEKGADNTPDIFGAWMR